MKRAFVKDERICKSFVRTNEVAETALVGCKDLDVRFAGAVSEMLVPFWNRISILKFG